MSLVLSKVSTLKAELRLAQAISEFQKDLSTEQKAAFCRTRDSSARTPPDYQDVMRLTEEIDRNASRLLKSRRCFGTRFTNILHAIQQFAALGDVIVGGSQNIMACGVWSLVRMTLLTVVNYSSYLEKLSALLMNVGRTAPRYEMLHQLYPRSKALQSHLSEYFIVVVRVCHRLLKMTKKSTFGQLVTFPSDADLKTHESELESISSLIKEEVALLMGQEIREQNSRINTILRSAEADAERQRQDAYVRVLTACSMYDYETTWKETRKLGTTSWFRQATEYREWRSSADSATLVCTGKLGSGKSVMLANLVGDLNLDIQAADCPVAYFFCRHDISDSLQCGTVIRSLGRQLLRSIPDLTSVDERFKRNAQIIESMHVLGLMLSLPRTFNAYFVLDGLDECSDQQRRQLIKELRPLQDAFNLRICVACRSDVGNLPSQMLESFAKSSLMALPDENPEIKQFIETELYSCIESGRLVLGEPQLSLEIADALSAGAQGMFLWVALQIEALCAERTDEAIRRALTELPGTLQETFARALDRSARCQTGKRTYSRRIFEFVIAAQRPLTTDELREALSVTPGDDVWNPGRHLNDVFSALASCGSLIMVEEENLTVRLIHHSVKQFLLGDEPSGRMKFLDDAHMAMRSTVLTYLNYGVFETQLSTTVAPSIPAQQAPFKIIRSMDKNSTSRNIALKLLKARSQPSVDIGKVVSETLKYTKPQTPDAYKFYAYAKSFWLHHAWLILERETVAYTMLVKVVSRVLSSSATTDNERQQIFFWAAKRGHPRILDLCVEHGLDIESRDPEMRATPLFWAAANGQHTTVKTLVKYGADLESEDLHHRTALSWAAEHGPYIIVETLIDCGANIEAGDRQGWTPLTYAASSGQEAVVTTLLERGADVEAYPGNDTYATPLKRSVMEKHAGIVRILLERGADPKKKLHVACMEEAIRQGDLPTLRVLLEHGVDPNISLTDENVSALHVAVMNDDQQIVRTLLDYGADPNRRDDAGRTPLVAAVSQGLPIQYEAMIKLLLRKDADLDIKNIEGKTALWYAALYGEARCVITLVENGCNRNVTAADGTTAWFVAENPGHHVRVAILIANGFKVNLKDGRGRTPLHYAAENGDLVVAELLLEHGADMESRDNAGLTPSELADAETLRALTLMPLLEGHGKRAGSTLVDQKPFRMLINKVHLPFYGVDDSELEQTNNSRPTRAASPVGHSPASVRSFLTRPPG